MKLAIIKYSAGNIQSVLNALERLGVSAQVTDHVEDLQAADKVIFPGVGEASSAMDSLRATGLDKLIPNLQQPVLGICVGMQLLGLHSEENNTKCLGIIPVRIRRFTPVDEGERLKIPQVGWNTIFDLSGPLFHQVPERSYVYNVHSYYAEDNEYCIARCDYGVTYAAALQKDNFYGVQFHAEKSAAAGDQLIKNFLEL